MTLLWVGFLGLIFACLALDLGVFHRRRGLEETHGLGLREAVFWTAVWIGVGLSFSAVIYLIYQYGWGGAQLHTITGLRPHDGRDAALVYLTAYVVEKSLSIDNLFVIALVFKTFGVAPRNQHRVLFWGILGAVVTRGVMITSGIELVQRFQWLFFVFGAYLAYAGVKIVWSGEDEEDEPDEGFIGRTMRRFLPVTDSHHGDRFVTRIDGKLFVTPLLICLFVVEFTDVVFALDSIPAVLAITSDNFVAYTSNIFAVLGLRSLYFVLLEMMERFQHLKTSIAVILVFVGGKLIAHPWVHVDERYSLGFIVLTLFVGIAWSWRKGEEAIQRKSRVTMATDEPEAAKRASNED